MTIELTFDLIDLIIFLLIAFVAGTAASALLVRYRYGTNPIVSTVLGMIGAFVGQYIFSALDLELQGRFFTKSITIADISIAFIGAVLVLLIVGAVRRA